MEKAYVGIMGGYTVIKDGDEKHEASHVILTNEEYRKLVKAKNFYKTQLEEEKKSHADEVKRVKHESQEYIKAVEDKVKKDIAAANERIVAAETEVQRQKNLNDNLLRIARERANAKRGLQPKKKHPGYRFSGKIMQTKAVVGYEKGKGSVFADVWTATLETPYPGMLPIDQIEGRVHEDLKGPEGILSRLHIYYLTCRNSGIIWKGSYGDAIGKNLNPEGKNCLFDYKFMVNPKTKLWELQITTTKSIQALEDMME